MPADTIRVATFNAELSRDGPGMLLRDILQGDPQAEAAARVIAAARPDVLVLTGIDFDAGLATLSAIAARIEATGPAYPYRFSLRPNTGRATGLDLDGDGRLRGPGDALGWGRYPGEGGMAILSRLPLDAGAARDFSGLPWRDLPGALIGGAGLAPGAAAILPLSTTGHWDVPVVLPGGARLHLLAWHATPPVFDGPEDRNGRRNHDEAAFWLRLLDGSLPWPAPEAPFVILGDANLDPADGDGRPDALAALVAHPLLQDPAPASAGGRAAALADGGVNATQQGDPARDTADFAETTPAGRPGPGNLRVDYVLPARALRVTASGVWWPAPDEPGRTDAAAASRHRLVWVDIALP